MPRLLHSLSMSSFHQRALSLCISGRRSGGKRLRPSAFFFQGGGWRRAQAGFCFQFSLPFSHRHRLVVLNHSSSGHWLSVPRCSVELVGYLRQGCRGLLSVDAGRGGRGVWRLPSSLSEQGRGRRRRKNMVVQEK
ncbi:unnamed protein product [Victoria cruziana]